VRLQPHNCFFTPDALHGYETLMQTAVESDRRDSSTDTWPALLISVICTLVDELWKRDGFVELVEHFVQVVIESILGPH